jgi:hypothetical protein
MNRYSNGREVRTRGGWFQGTHSRQPKPRNIWEISDAYFESEFESEWEIQEAGHYGFSAGVDEAEWEAPFHFQQTLHNIRKTAQATASIAGQIGSIAAKTLMQETSGLGKQISPRTNRFLKTLL